MSTIQSAPALLRRADEITTANSNGGASVAPPAFAAQCPLEELLLADIAASVPSDVLVRLRNSRTLDQVDQLYAVTALYKWIASDPLAGRRFLDGCAQDPKAAAFAWARAVASRMEPLPREPMWHRHDRLGAAMQLMFAGLLLMCRGLVLAAFLRGMGLIGHVTNSDWPRLLAGVDLFATPPPRGMIPPLLLCCASLWLALEVCLLPAVELARRLPFLDQPIQNPPARVELPYVVWSLWALGMSAGCIWRAIRFVGPSLGPWRSIGVIGAAVVAFILWCVATHVARRLASHGAGFAQTGKP